MHKKKEGRGKFFHSLFFLDDFSNLMGTFGTNVNESVSFFLDKQRPEIFLFPVFSC